MARNKENDWFKEKWKGVPITPINIDEHMSDIYKKTKGQYVTQGVSFNKDDSFQMGLLRQAILTHGTFSSFMKHLMHTYFIQQQQIAQLQQQSLMNGMNIGYNHQQTSIGWMPDEKTLEEVTSAREIDLKEPEEEIKQEVEELGEEAKNDSTSPTDLDDKKPSVDTTTKEVKVKVNVGGRRGGGRRNTNADNPFLQSNPNATPPSE